MNSNFSIDVNVRLSLDESTAQLIAGIAACIFKPELRKPSGNVNTDPQPAQKPDAPEPVQAEDRPEVRIITDEELRQTVKETKDRTGADPIRAVFTDFGVSSSVKVPQERRQEFVDRLKSL